MALTLRQKQSKFAFLVALLIMKVDSLGYEITLGETYRSPEEAKRLHRLGKGSANSLHIDKLAIDINLFRNGRYLTSTESHRMLGEWWESLSTNEYTCHWGGHFNDGNHYSVGHGGRK